MITGISGFGFSLSKNGRFVTNNCFSESGVLKPLFLLCFGVRVSGPSCQKREILDSHHKKSLTDN